MNYFGMVLADSKESIEAASNRDASKSNLAKTMICKENEFPQKFDLHTILFIATSKDKSEVEEVIGAVCKTYNSWCLNKESISSTNERFQLRSEWTTTEESRRIQSGGFVYVYRKWEESDSILDEAFYVGMSDVGNEERETDHIRDTYRNLKTKTDLTKKEITIQKWLQIKNLIIKDEYDGSKHKLVNRIAEGLTKTAALAVEQFLINHYYSVYKLTNNTGGNQDLKTISTIFISRPRWVPNEYQNIWESCIKKFISNRGVLGQKAHFNIQLIALATFTEFGKDIIDASHDKLMPDGKLRNTAADVEWSWVFQANKGPEWIRLQFKFSASRAKVCINLRPASGYRWSEFREEICKIWQEPEFKCNSKPTIYLNHLPSSSR